MVGIRCIRMPKECMTDEGTNNGCPIDKMWCAQMHAPYGHTMSQIVEDRTGKIPSWCPLMDLSMWGYDGE